MAYNPNTGALQLQDESVSKRVTDLTASQSPMMRQARSQGAQASNRRGLLNSSMGVQAGQTAAYSAALPIASQEAQQAHQTNLQGRDIQSREKVSTQDRQAQERIATMNVAAHEREKAASLAAAFENNYTQMMATVMNNPDIPSATRQQYIQHAAKVRDSNLKLVEQFYGINLDWNTPGATGSTAPTSTATTSTVTPNPDSGGLYSSMADRYLLQGDR